MKIQEFGNIFLKTKLPRKFMENLWQFSQIVKKFLEFRKQSMETETFFHNKGIPRILNQIRGKRNIFSITKKILRISNATHGTQNIIFVRDFFPRKILDSKYFLAKQKSLNVLRKVSLDRSELLEANCTSRRRETLRSKIHFV